MVLNSRRSSGSHKYDDFHYFDQLPARIRRALWEGPQEWDSCKILTKYRRLRKEGEAWACRQIIDEIERWNKMEIRVHGQTGHIASMQRY
jgi:hypothetical protein